MSTCMRRNCTRRFQSSDHLYAQEKREKNGNYVGKIMACWKL